MTELSDDQTADHNQFFVDGGTLDPKIRSYVMRRADRDLLQRVLNGEFCYVLTARQMGKSSLMVRTARRLEEQNVKTAIIDLTIIATVPLEQWYLGLLRLIGKALELRTDVSTWWRERYDLGAPQRFFEFFREAVLHENTGPVAIFIDEIDTALNLDFRDGFFGAIRAMYNARANDQTFNRLTFVLLGAATPNDLIKDQKTTPFNIGTRIELQDFSYDDATPLRQGLNIAHPSQGDRILRRILHWTNGHPYLTQRLCLLAAQSPPQDWDDGAVDQLVQINFFAEDTRSDPNLAFVEDCIQAAPVPERRQMLTLYERVYRDERISNDDRSTAQNYLELFGLVRVEATLLRVSNEIYRHVFDPSWILTHMPLIDESISSHNPTPPDRWRWSPTFLIGLAFALVLVAVFILLLPTLLQR